MTDIERHIAAGTIESFIEAQASAYLATPMRRRGQQAKGVVHDYLASKGIDVTVIENVLSEADWKLVARSGPAALLKQRWPTPKVTIRSRKRKTRSKR